MWLRSIARSSQPTSSSLLAQFLLKPADADADVDADAEIPVGTIVVMGDVLTANDGVEERETVVPIRLSPVEGGLAEPEVRRTLVLLEAAEEREKALKARTEEEYRLVAGMEHEKAGEYEKAAERYRLGLAYEPGERFCAYFLHNNYGYCLNVLGQHAEAEWYCRAAIDLDPSRPNGFKNLGISLEALRSSLPRTNVGTRGQHSQLFHRRIEQVPEVRNVAGDQVGGSGGQSGLENRLVLRGKRHAVGKTSLGE
jgi:tetratricopeptide (TPR) repeat protein